MPKRPPMELKMQPMLWSSLHKPQCEASWAKSPWTRHLRSEPRSISTLWNPSGNLTDVVVTLFREATDLSVDYDTARHYPQTSQATVIHASRKSQITSTVCLCSNMHAVLLLLHHKVGCSACQYCMSVLRTLCLRSPAGS